MPRELCFHTPCKAVVPLPNVVTVAVAWELNETFHLNSASCSVTDGKCSELFFFHIDFKRLETWTYIQFFWQNLSKQQW